MDTKKIVITLAAVATATAFTPAAPAGASTVDYSGSYSVQLPDIPAIETHLFELCVGNPGDLYRHCETYGPDTPGITGGTLTLSWTASRDGQAPTVQESKWFPVNCGGSPGAEILLTTYSSLTRAGAELHLTGNQAGPVDVTVPVQEVPGNTAVSIPARACIYALN